MYVGRYGGVENLHLGHIRLLYIQVIHTVFVQSDFYTALELDPSNNQAKIEVARLEVSLYTSR